MSSFRVLSVLLLLGCGATGEVSAAEDARRYAEAASSGDPARCAAIRDPGLAGECAALLARELAQASDVSAALALCESLPQGAWRDECFFLVADAGSVEDQAARRACAQAGRFRNQCIGHALAREVAAALNDPALVAVGAEEQLRQRLDEALADNIVSPQERSNRVRRIVAEQIAGRDEAEPFSRAVCGVAPDPICQDAYTLRLQRAEDRAQRPEGAWRRACPAPTRERAASLEIPPWTEEVDALVQGAWDRLCRGSRRALPRR